MWPNLKMLRIMHEDTWMNWKTIVYVIINRTFVVFVHPAELQGHLFVLSHPATATLTDRLKATTDREWKWKDGPGEMGLDVGQKPLSDTTHPSELCCTEGWKGRVGQRNDGRIGFLTRQWLQNGTLSTYKNFNQTFSQGRVHPKFHAFWWGKKKKKAICGMGFG